MPFALRNCSARMTVIGLVACLAVGFTDLYLLATLPEYPSIHDSWTVNYDPR